MNESIDPSVVRALTETRDAVCARRKSLRYHLDENENERLILEEDLKAVEKELCSITKAVERYKLSYVDLYTEN